MSTPTPTDKLLSTIGLCARARKLIPGTPMVCEAMRKGGRAAPLLVLEASDTSENTHAKLTSKCAYYGVPHRRIPADTATLGHAIGKSGAVAAVGITDPELLRAIARYLPAPAEEGEPDTDHTAVSATGADRPGKTD